MQGENQTDLRMNVDRLDLDPAALLAQTLGDAVGGPPLGIGAGQPSLERAELVDHLHAPRGIHAGGIIAVRGN